jgi:hypothetical protein
MISPFHQFTGARCPVAIHRLRVAGLDDMFDSNAELSDFVSQAGSSDAQPLNRFRLIPPSFAKDTRD